MNHDQSAADTINQEIYKRTYAFISRRVRQKEDVEEIIQNVYLNLLNSKKTVAESKVQAWLFIAARNATADFYRKKSRTPATQSIDKIELIIDEEIIRENQIIECLMPLMKNLSDQDKQLLVEIDMKGISQKDFAKKNKVKYPTLKSKLQRARQKLKIQLLNCCKMTLSSKGIPIESDDDCCF